MFSLNEIQKTGIIANSNTVIDLKGEAYTRLCQRFLSPEKYVKYNNVKSG